MENKFSIIVPVYNSINTIGECIKSLLKLKNSNYEIIIIDDGSSDNSLNVIKFYAKKSKKIKIIKQSNKGPASARNLGIKKAHYNIIVFTDSDCIVTKNWLNKYDSYFKKNKSELIGGGIKPLSLNNKYESFEDFRKKKLYGTDEMFVRALPSCNLAVRKEVFDKIGLFDESFKNASSEDYDLCYRAVKSGFKILYSPMIFIFHKHPQTLKGLIRRGYIHSKEGIKLRKKHNEYNLLKEILSLFKILILPIIIFKKYPIKLIFPALCYEISGYLGKLKGLLYY